MEFKAFLAHARPHGRDLALVVLLSLIGSLAGLAIPWLGANLLGGIVELGEHKLLGVTLLLVLALLGLTLFRILSALVSSVVANRIEASFRRDIYAHVQRLPLGFFDQSRQGDLLALLTWEVSHLATFLSTTLTAIPAALVTCAGATVILFVLDPRLALLVPVLVPAYYVALKIIGRRMRGLATKVQEAEAAVFACAEEDLEMLPAIKAFAREEVRLKLYAQAINKARRLKVQQQKLDAMLAPTLSLVTGLAAVVLILAAGQSIASDRLGTTELFGFLFYAAMLTRPVGSLASFYGQFNFARGTLQRLHHVLQEATEPGYASVKSPGQCEGWISFQDISFAYRDRPDTLQEFNLDIQAGEIVALTGANGAGKSTIIKLLLGFYYPREGQIKIDGIDIREFNIQELRARIGYVPQRPLLQNGTVRENITLGLKDLPQEMVELVCELAQAHEFISKLPQGYFTEVGDHGVRLSGGQRQRIALARALLANPQILVLDEATSMYDLDGESALVEACRTALVGRTVIIITHRPASLALADRIVTVRDGKVIDVAPSTKLVSQRG